MPKEDLHIGKLFFCELVKPDGELAVGLCRLEGLARNTASFSWFCRKNYATMREWGNSQLFVPYVTKGRKVEKGTVDVAAFLPVAVQQTNASIRAWQREARSIAGSKVRLSKACLTELRGFCAIRCPELLHATEGSGKGKGKEEGSGEGEEGSGEEDSSEGEEGESEGEEEEEEEEREAVAVVRQQGRSVRGAKAGRARMDSSDSDGDAEWRAGESGRHSGSKPSTSAADEVERGRSGLTRSAGEPISTAKQAFRPRRG
jgi:hypothetical protein